MNKIIATAALLAASGVAFAQLDGQNIPSDAALNGLTLLGTQQNATQFGNAVGGGQDSAGGSELNQLWASLDGTTLNVSITGNLEGNFNKFFIFFDAVAGGENVLANDNADGGFGEINNLAGLTFDNGATMDHGLRIEIGSGFWGINAFDLIDNTAQSVGSGGGPGDLPLSGVSGAGVTAGWDNSNVLGVSDVDASTAASATTGWEFSIDLASFFGGASSQVGISAVIANGVADFLSNQVLPSAAPGSGNLGDPSTVTLPVAVIPTPGSAGLLALAGLAAIRRRR